MGKLKERLLPLIESMEEKGKKVENLAELERLILEEGPQLLRTSYETLAEEREGIFPPEMPMRGKAESKTKATGRFGKSVGKG